MKREKKKQETEEEKSNKKKLKSLIENSIDLLFFDVADSYLHESSNKRYSEYLKESLLVEGVLAKAFIEPFTDVFKTAMAGVESTISSVANNSRKVAIQVAAAALPFIAASEVSRLGEEEAERIKNKLQQIDSKYSDVLGRNIEALRTKDPAGFAFLFNPGLVVGAHAAAWALGKGVQQASGGIAWNLDFLSKITSEVPAISNKFDSLKNKFETLSQKASDVSSKVVSKPMAQAGFSGSGVLGYGDDGGDFGDFGESINRKNRKTLKEADAVAQPAPAKQTNFTTDELNKKMGEVVQALLQNNEVKKAIEKSKLTTIIRKAAIDSLVDRIEKVASFKTLDDFSKFSGSEMNKYQQDIESKIPKNIDEAKKKEFEEQAVLEMKKSYKKVYEQYLKKLAETGGKNSLQQLQIVQNSLSKLG